MTYDSDSGRLTFLKKKTACSQEWLHASTGKLYHSLSHWIVFIQVSYLTNLSSTSGAPSHFVLFLPEKNCNLHIHWMHNWKWYHLIELAKSFLLKYRCWSFTRSQLALYMRSFEHLASLYLHHRETYLTRSCTCNRLPVSMTLGQFHFHINWLFNKCFDIQLQWFRSNCKIVEYAWVFPSWSLVVSYYKGAKFWNLEW